MYAIELLASEDNQRSINTEEKQPRRTRAPVYVVPGAGNISHPHQVTTYVGDTRSTSLDWIHKKSCEIDNIFPGIQAAGSQERQGDCREDIACQCVSVEGDDIATPSKRGKVVEVCHGIL